MRTEPRTEPISETEAHAIARELRLPLAPAEIASPDTPTDMIPAIRLHATLVRAIREIQPLFDYMALMSDIRHMALTRYLTDLLPGFDPVTLEKQTLANSEIVLTQMLTDARSRQTREQLTGPSNLLIAEQVPGQAGHSGRLRP